MSNTYNDFLSRKLVRHRPDGFDMTSGNDKLFDWQSSVVRWLCEVGCGAAFEDCGLGKTPQQLLWAQNVVEHTGGNVLILAPLAVSQQTKREGEKFGVAVNVAADMDSLKGGINITNYEKLDKFDAAAFAGVVLDESSILKSYMGKTKRQITEMFKNTPYKLACTATPAPNDLMELLNHAEFLGIMRSSEALSIWFIADQSDSGKYKLKGHAEQDFWQWVASWAVCISAPSDIGYEDTGYVLPELTERNEIVSISELSGDSSGSLFREIDTSATGFYAEKRRTQMSRCERVAEIVSGLGGEQCVVWCYQNDEADELKKLIPNSIEIRGADKPETKERGAIDFIDGKHQILISKPSIFGYGLNFQNCRNCVFCGMDYSYESYYQAVRRFYRFGQTLPVNVWRVIGSTEMNILRVIENKQNQKNEMQRGMSEAMRSYQTEAIQGHAFKLDLTPQTITPPQWLRSTV